MDARLLSKAQLFDEFKELRKPFKKVWKEIVRNGDSFYRTDKGERILWAVGTGRASEDKMRDVVDILRRETSNGLLNLSTIKSTAVDNLNQCDVIQKSLNRLPNRKKISKDSEAQKQAKISKKP